MNELFYEIFSDLPRQGPGDDEYTRKAYHIIPALPPDPIVVDIGCGTGMQTMELARICFGEVTGIDNHKPFIDELNRKIAEEGLDNCKGVVGDMFELDLDYESVDLLWSEGAIFIMGFENGLIQWKKFLKSGGYLVISEMVWLEEHRPEEVQNFFDQEVPGMLMPDEQEKIIDDCGYEIIESIQMPAEVWWGNFYAPLQERVIMLREKYKNNEQSLDLIEKIQLEIDIYKKYNDYYGYIFYIMRRKDA